MFIYIYNIAFLFRYGLSSKHIYEYNVTSFCFVSVVASFVFTLDNFLFDISSLKNLTKMFFIS